MNKSQRHAIIIFTDEETRRLKFVLDTFEQVTKFETSEVMISGGFAIAEFEEFSNGTIYIKLRHGVQSDCTDRVHEEHYELPLEKLNKNPFYPLEVQTYFEQCGETLIYDEGRLVQDETNEQEQTRQAEI